MPWRNKRQPVRAESADGEVYLRRLTAQQERGPSNDAKRDSVVKAVNDDDASFLSVETEDSDDLDDIVEDLDDPPDRYDAVESADEPPQFAPSTDSTNPSAAAERSGAGEGGQAPGASPRSSQADGNHSPRNLTLPGGGGRRQKSIYRRGCGRLPDCCWELWGRAGQCGP